SQYAMTSDSSRETLTFVFTDLESSTRLWERFPEAMKAAMERHDAILRDAVENSDGRVVKIMGDGLMAVFSSATDGVEACLEAQRALGDEAWRETGPLRVRIGMHVGQALTREGDFFGPPVNRAARIMAAAHGGQVLLSELAAALTEPRLPAEAGLRDLGEHRLKDLFQPEHIFQLVHPSLASDFPPLATLSYRPNNLPTQTSELLGREAQLAVIRDLLDTAGVRLLTLTGPGGIGKTRLALQAAADQIDRFEDGVYFVDLSSVRDANAVFETIVRAVGLTGANDEQLLETLKLELRTRHMLLVLDNFEQVMDAADSVADLLHQCSELKVLVTSREALSVRGEHLLVVPPLSVPDTGVALLTAELVGEHDAVRLFVERAREARPGFALTDDNAAAIGEISARLDGLPLAIELAAARVKLFSPQELSDRLRSRLELLGRGPRDLPVRQQTLRSTIEWSYDLLDGEERAIFQLLSVFSPTTVEAVEEVVGRLESLEDIDFVDRLASLVDKSLLQSVEGDGPQRLSLLETIREYAAERLAEEPGLGSAARLAHAGYFSDFAQTRRDRLYGSEREEALAELQLELGNLLTAWRYWVAARDLLQLERMLDALWVLHDARGWYHRAVELTNDLLAVLSSVPATPDRTQEEITLRTSLARGILAIRGYTEEAEAAFMAALALSEEARGGPRRFPELRSLATFHLYRGEFDKASAIGSELLELAEQQDDPGLQVDGHLIVGSSVAFLGDVPTGLDHLDRAIALFHPDRYQPGPLRLGPSSGVSSYTTSALLLWLLGFPDRAAERAARALELAGQLNHPFTLAYTRFHVGLLDLWRGEYELVEARGNGVLEVAEEHDYPIWKALGLTLGGAATNGLGRTEEGLARIDRGIALYQGLKTPPVFWPLLLSLKAGALGLSGRAAGGLELVDEAVAIMGEDNIQEDNIQLPDFALLKGDLLLGLADAQAAESHFRGAFEIAERLGLRMPQLRAATRLARLRKRPDATDVLRDVYETFTEGFETPDLLQARMVLEEVDARV
ncbi:MAG TPA: adenylate/guanylate cyclase domain-containing protein, partial [Gaiellaceae bacterium]|nr:adenylate/guanylate cyclase domain-containing protein [Gaiellaceae bacterium]